MKLLKQPLTNLPPSYLCLVETQLSILQGSLNLSFWSVSPTTHLPVLHLHWNALCAQNTWKLFNTMKHLQAFHPSCPSRLTLRGSTLSKPLWIP